MRNRPHGHRMTVSKDIDSDQQPSPSTTSITSTPQTGTNPVKTSPSLFQKAFTAIGATTSIAVAGTFFVLLAWRRDALMVSFFIGAISNGILSKVLKKILKQARPEELNLEEMDLKPSDNGMPSSHAMSLGFIGTFTALILPWMTIPIVLYVIASLLYRIQTNLHSEEQILVGVTIGTINGFLWKHLCFGENPLNVHVMDWVTTLFLNDQGKLPIIGLLVPALVGALVVGSVERRISRFWKELKKEV